MIWDCRQIDVTHAARPSQSSEGWGEENWVHVKAVVSKPHCVIPHRDICVCGLNRVGCVATTTRLWTTWRDRGGGKVKYLLVYIMYVRVHICVLILHDECAAIYGLEFEGQLFMQLLDSKCAKDKIMTVQVWMRLISECCAHLIEDHGIPKAFPNTSDGAERRLWAKCLRCCKKREMIDNPSPWMHLENVNH